MQFCFPLGRGRHCLAVRRCGSRLHCLETTMATAPDSGLQDARPDGSRSSSAGLSGESDYRLVTRIVHRDESAFGAIYDRYSRLIYSVVLRVVKDAAIAEDILHDIFLNLWRSPQQFDAARGKLAAMAGGRRPQPRHRLDTQAASPGRFVRCSTGGR